MGYNAVNGAGRPREGKISYFIFPQPDWGWERK